MSTTSLILVCGSFLLVMAAVAAWLFRTASAPFYVKIIIPSLLTGLACATPLQLPSILGWPVETTFALLPQQAELVAFVPYDDDKRVDLWLRERHSDPRAYSIPMTDGLRSTLDQAKKALASGPVAIGKRTASGKKRPHQYSDIDGGNAPYELLPGAYALPRKADSN